MCNVQGYFEELIGDAQEAILSMLGNALYYRPSLNGRFARV
jgi:hypothetical protein